MKINLIHVTTVHQRYDTRIFHRECINLTQFMDVTLLVSDGKGNEINNRVQIVDAYASNNRLRKLFAVFKWLLKIKKRNNTILHLHDPELYLCCWFFKMLGFKVVLDIHEDYSKQILLKNYIPSKLLRAMLATTYKTLEKGLLKSANFSVVPQPSFLTKYNTILVGNFISLAEANKLKGITQLEKDRSFIYAGGITEERGLGNMLILAEQLKNHNYKLKIAGNFQNEKLKHQASMHPGWSNVHYLGFMDRAELLIEQKKSTAAVILFNNVGQYYLSYSVKLFEYTACGLPILMPNFGEWIAINSDYNVGVNVDVKNIVENDISSVVALGKRKDFLENCQNFLKEHSLDDNISHLYNRYRALMDDNK